MPLDNPFGDDPVQPPRPHPFGGEDADEGTPTAAATRIERAARSIRGLRGQIGAEGLTPSAMRQLLDETAAALDAAARALRGLET